MPTTNRATAVDARSRPLPRPAPPECPPGIATRTRPEDPAPPVRGLTELRQAAACCRACPLYRTATQTVFGAGPGRARMMLVGEQPGNDEDLAGKPFVGPAGKVLTQLLKEAGIDRKSLYLTNAVKHFKFVQQGKRRLHQKPKGMEIKACRPWLLAEIERVRPQVLVALGAVAGAALFGNAASVTRDRGRPVESPLAPRCFITYHPSAALRGITPADRARVRTALLDDLRAAASTDTTLRDGHVAAPDGPDFASSKRKIRRK
jgi:uracil-DNA glycosylase